MDETVVEVNQAALPARNYSGVENIGFVIAGSFLAILPIGLMVFIAITN